MFLSGPVCEYILEVRDEAIEVYVQIEALGG